MENEKYIIYIFLFIYLSILGTGCATTNPATGEKHLSLITEQKEIKLGKNVSKKLEDHFGVVTNLKIQNKIEKIGNRLSQNCTRKKLTYHFDVLDEKEPNAISLPGGYVYVTKGLFDELKTKSQIASVLAHEISHIEARHSIHRLQKSLGYGTLMMILSSQASQTTQKKANKAINELFLAYSRKDEYQADKLALDLLSKSKYNPKAMIEVLNIIKKIEREKPIEVLHPQTHPYINDRIRRIKILLSGKINFDDYINKTYKNN